MNLYEVHPDFPSIPALASVVVASLAAIVVAVVRVVLHRRESQRRFAGAKYVAIAAPPEVDAAGAATLWLHLAAIERGRWRRFWTGQPHLIFEYAFTGPSLSVRIWVPGDVSTAMVTQAITSAWPGATCTVTEAEPPLAERK